MKRLFLVPLLLGWAAGCGGSSQPEDMAQGDAPHGANGSPPGADSTLPGGGDDAAGGDSLLSPAGQPDLSAGQTGGEVGAGDVGNGVEGGLTGNGANVGCVEEVAVLKDREAPTTLGISVDDLLTMAEGEHIAPLEWHEVVAFTLNGEVPVNVTPESGTSEITVSVSHEGGEMRYVSSEPDPNRPGNLLAMCSDRLEVDVDVSLRTQGGAFDEQFVTTLTATTPFLTEFRQPFELETLSGDLSLSAPGAENPEYVQMSFLAQFGPQGFFAGNIGGTLQQSNSMVASAGPLDLASWGDNPCEPHQVPVPLEADFEGLSPAQTLSRINDGTALPLTWTGGSQSSLTQSVSLDGQYACFEAGLLYMTGLLNASSADGRIDTSIGVDVIAHQGEDFELDRVEVIFNAYFTKSVPVAEFEQTFGIHDVDLGDHETATISFSTTYFSDGSITGSMEVIGITPAMCSDEPGAACPGPTTTSVESASWSNAE